MALLTPGLVVAVLLVILGVTTVGVAQKDAGAIVGLVRDASGAVVTGAKVTVTDVDRGIQLTLSTNDAGEYVASPLRIGRYSITVEKQGFKKAVAGPVQVNIQDRVGVDLKLEAGAITEVVTVTGERAQLETETSELGQVVDSRRINALPPERAQLRPTRVARHRCRSRRTRIACRNHVRIQRRGRPHAAKQLPARRC